VDGGQVFGYGADDLMWNGTWTVSEGTFKLSTGGEEGVTSYRELALGNAAA
jgi:hypothetical protein